MPHLKLFVLGQPRLERDGKPLELNLRKALALLVYLAVSGQRHSRDALATLLWPESNQSEGRGRLRRTLHRLIEVIGDDILEGGSEAIRLHPHAELWLDCAAFRQHATAGLAAPAQDLVAPERLADLNAAVELYSDDFLAGFTLPDSPAFDEWQFFQRESLRQLYGQVLEQLIQAYRTRQIWDQAIIYARQWLALDGLHEPAHRMLMRLYAWAGQPAAALRQYQECVRIINAELGAAPEDETTALYESIRTRQLARPEATASKPGPASQLSQIEPDQRYVVEERLAEGGQGEIFRARDQLTGQPVAVKWLKAELADRHPDLVARFVREGAALRRLNHPNIVSILDSFERAGRYAIVMEYVPGGSLRALLDAEHQLVPERVLAIGLELADALSRAHHLGIIHRDLKPENVLLAADGTPRLTDFGLARLEWDDARLTRSGTLFGSPAYMSPEAVRGQELDARSDVWSLGVVLYELLAGRRPFEGVQITPVLAAIQADPVPDLRTFRPDTPPALVELLERMLLKERALRLSSMRQVAAALEAIRDRNPTEGILAEQHGQSHADQPIGMVADTRAAASPAVAQPVTGAELTARVGPRAAVQLGGIEDAAPPAVATEPVFVARELELERLDALLDAALAGQSQVAFVTGEAGQGKTALLLAFAQRAHQAHPDLIVAGGNCNAYTGAGDPYLPFRQILAMLTGDVHACPLVDRLWQEHAERLWNSLPAAVQVVLDLGPNLLDTFVSARRLLSRAAHVSSGAAWLAELQALADSKPPTPSNPEQQDLFAQYAKVVQALARGTPLLLLLDDVQWIDIGSANLLLYLGRHLPRCRVLIAGAYRPAEVAMGRDGQRHPLERVVNEFQRDYGEITLDLSRAEGRLFIDALLDAEPNQIGESFRATLYQQTGGHPLFTIELLRDLQERGALTRDAADRWVVAPNLDWSSLPARVEGAIGERVNRLDARLREILQIASVEGEEFTAELVAQVLGVDEHEVVRRLSRELDQAHHLVRALGVQRDDGLRLSRYRFQHILIQRYLYNSLDGIERAYLNEALGCALETLYRERTEQVAVQLAWYFREAAIPRKAIHYLLEAGRVASRRSAHDEAIGHFNQALALLETLPDTATRAQQELELQLALGPTLVAARGYAVPEVMQAYSRARELLPHAERSADLFRVLFGLWGFYLVRAELQTARDLAEQALSLAQWLQNPALILEAHRAIGMILFHVGEFVGARDHLEQGSILYDPQQHGSLALESVADPGVTCLSYLARTLWHLGYPEQALKKSNEAVELAQSLGHPFSLAAAHVYTARVRQCRREAPATQDHADAAIALSTEYHFPHYIAMGTILHGWAIAHQRDLAEGIDRMRQGLDAGHHTQIQIARTHFLAMLAEGYAAAGQAEAGRSVLDEALASAARSHELQWTADLHRLKGELLLASANEGPVARPAGEREYPEATPEELFRTAIEIARRQGSKSLELRAAVSLGRLWREQAKAAEARQMLSGIYGWFTEGFDTADLKEAKSLLEDLGDVIPTDGAPLLEAPSGSRPAVQLLSGAVTRSGRATEQQIRFCTAPDGVRIAYATVGAGPVLVKAANWLSHLEYDWNSPVWRHWLTGLAERHTLVRYDRRGCGLSDWEVEDMSLEARLQDLETVVAALKLDRFALMGLSGGGSAAIAYAVRHPEKVSHLVLYGSYARGRLKRELTPAQIEEVQTLRQVMQIGWGKKNAAFRQVYTTLFIPDGTPEQSHWFNELQRISTSPEVAVRIAAADWSDDLTELARQVAVPTLVLHAREDAVVPFEEGRQLAALIPGAQFVPLSSKNHILLESEPAWQRFLAEVHHFL